MSDDLLRLQDEYIRWIISNGIGVVYPSDPEKENRLYRNRMKYLEGRLQWPEMPFLVLVELYHYLWMNRLKGW